MIRLPNTPGLNGTAINAPQLKPGALAAQGMALGDLGESLVDVSDHFAATAIQLKRMENGRLLSERRMGLASSYADHQLQLQNDPDPASRLLRTKEFLALAKQEIDNEDLPPSVRESLSQHFEEFASRAVIFQAEDSAKLSAKRSMLAFENEFSDAVQRRDRDGAAAALSTAADAGVLLPEEMDAQWRKFDLAEAYGAEQDMIESDPLGSLRKMSAPDYLENNPKLTPEAVDSLRRQAESKANRYRADFANDMIISGTMPTADELQAMESDGLIDKATHARWVSKIRSGAQPKMDPAIYEETYGQIMSYDPAKDPSGRVEAQMRSWIASQPLPEAAVKELNDRFTSRLNPADSKKPKNVHERSFSSKIQTDFLRGDWGKFRFPVDREEYDKAWKLRGQFAEEWRAVLGSMPEDVPFQQVTEAYDALKKSFKGKRPMPDLKFTPNAPAAFDADEVYRKISPGGNFGGQKIKPAGEAYQGAAATVFGGTNDPADNGLSAFGGKTGEGGREGTAIPQDLLKAKFPGKDKAWIAENVRTVVRAPNGVAQTLKVADFGTAEWVWKRAGRPTLDLTENAAKQLGGEVVYNKAGKMQGVRGLDNLDFAVVSIDTGGAPLAGSSWEDAKSAWFRANRPPSYSAATNSLIALREAWNEANMETTDGADDALLPPIGWNQ